VEHYTLTDAEERLLASCVGSTFHQIVWDLNAVYLVTGETGCIKIEVVADAPPRGIRCDDYDEIVFIRMESLAPSPHFELAGEEGFWYRVVASESRIRAIEIARAAVGFPSGVVSSPDTTNGEGAHVIADAGVLITLEDDLVLPAVPLFNSFGFATWPETRLYQRAEVDALLEGKYSLRPPHVQIATIPSSLL
jgi:hypothetical protein